MGLWFLEICINLLYFVLIFCSFGLHLCSQSSEESIFLCGNPLEFLLLFPCFFDLTHFCSGKFGFFHGKKRIAILR